MKERIEAVQRVYWTVLTVALVLIVLGLPLGNDGETMAVLDELTAFQAAFEQNKGAVEGTLLTHAKAAGMVPLATLEQAIQGPGLPKITVDKDAAAIEPRAALDLSTISRIQALAQPGTTITIASVDSQALAEALSWRITKNAKPGASYALTSIALTPDASAASDVERELEVAKLRRDLIAAEKDLVNKQAAYVKLDELYEARRKWRATWKVLQRTNGDRLEAKAAQDKAQSARDGLAARYDSLSKEAEAFEKGAPQPLGEAGTTSHAVAVVTIKPSTGDAITMNVPARVDVRAVPVPSITGADLPITRATSFWDGLQDGTAAQAIAQVKDRFSWHYAHVDLGGIKLGGMTLLQLAPLALIPCLLLLIRRSRRVASSYNPFDKDAAALPRVGLGVTPINIAILVILPIAGCVLCAMSLVELGQLPLVPMTVGLAVVGLGGAAHVSLRELSELRDAVRRSHSHPPVAITKATK